MLFVYLLIDLGFDLPVNGRLDFAPLVLNQFSDGALDQSDVMGSPLVWSWQFSIVRLLRGGNR